MAQRRCKMPAHVSLNVEGLTLDETSVLMGLTSVVRGPDACGAATEARLTFDRDDGGQSLHRLEVWYTCDDTDFAAAKSLVTDALEAFSSALGPVPWTGSRAFWGACSQGEGPDLRCFLREEKAGASRSAAYGAESLTPEFLTATEEGRKLEYAFNLCRPSEEDKKVWSMTFARHAGYLTLERTTLLEPDVRTIFRGAREWYSLMLFQKFHVSVVPADGNEEGHRWKPVRVRYERQTNGPFSDLKAETTAEEVHFYFDDEPMDDISKPFDREIRGDPAGARAFFGPHPELTDAIRRSLKLDLVLDDEE